MQSIWSQTAEAVPREQLQSDIRADVAVIGAGMAGILIGYLLKSQGLDVVVLEADAVGGGQTKNTTAKITAQHDARYAKMIEQFGRDGAHAYVLMNRSAIDRFEEIIGREGIDCNFTKCPSYLYTTRDPEALREEAEALESLGQPVRFTTDTALPFEVTGAVRMEDQARFHPLRFLYALSQKLRVYEKSRVTQVDGQSLRVNGQTVSANHIVFATHFPFINVPGYYFLRMHQERSYVLALRHAGELDGMYLGVDEDGISLRSEGDLILFGGEGHRTGENSKGGRYEALERTAKSIFPKSRQVAQWSAQDCVTLDGVPFIGRFSADTPHWYVATGFMKWGMTTSMVAANIITDIILKKDNPFAEVFSPQRSTPLASAASLLNLGVQAVKGLARQNLVLPSGTLENLPLGHGGIVSADGEKAGVYKDQFGQTFAVHARCPHVGCQTEWNPDEKSWDCPCHGSRFDHTGKLIDGPAQTDLIPL
ncbi:MAG: FAD-dependent oxidoreductase [Bacillota bacterium]